MADWPRIAGVLATPRVAAALAGQLRQLVGEYRAAGGTPRPDVLAFVEACEQEARATRLTAPTPAETTSAGGSAGSALSGSDATMAPMTASEVANVLKITDRGVRDLAIRGSLTGRKRAGTWLFDHDDVAAYAAKKADSA